MILPLGGVSIFFIFLREFTAFYRPLIHIYSTYKYEGMATVKHERFVCNIVSQLNVKSSKYLYILTIFYSCFVVHFKVS